MVNKFYNPEPPMQYQSHEEEQVQDEDEPHESGNFETLDEIEPGMKEREKEVPTLE